MKPLSEENLFNKLVYFVEHDDRLQGIAVRVHTGEFKLEIGGQAPFWEYKVDKSRLKSGNLEAYASEIVDEWAQQRPPRP